MPSIWRTAASLLLAAVLGGCSLAPSALVLRVALLAPFEGEYRHIGYNALYAAQLALERNPLYELLAVDDGGTLTQAVQRAAALQRDPDVVGVVVLGPFSTHPQVQAALDGTRVVIAGGWSASPAVPHSVQLAPSSLQQVQTSNDLTDERADHPQSALGVQFLSMGVLPDADYAARYTALSPFAPSPNTYATLVTDAFSLLMAAHQSGLDLRSTTLQGINGLIAFDAQGFWINAPVYLYEITAAGYQASRLQ